MQVFDGSNKRNLPKSKKKTLQRKARHFHCSKFDTLPVSCWFTNLFGTSLKKVLSIWKQGKFGLVILLLVPFCPGAKYLKVKKPVHVRQMRIHWYSTAITCCSCLYLIVNEISWNKTKNCQRRLTALECRCVLNANARISPGLAGGVIPYKSDGSARRTF